MRYQLHLSMTEEDYLNFNYFQTMESEQGKRMLMKSRLLLLVIMAAAVLLMVIIIGLDSFLIPYVSLMVIITVIYMAFYKKIFGRNLRKQILKTKKAGRLPYEPDVEYEFYEDKVVAIAPETRTECSYRQIERICVVGERYIYAYNSSVSALVLSVPQICQQVNEAEFLQFLTEKCPNVEHYQ